MPETGHCVINEVESWSGVLEWSNRVESLSGLWCGMKSDLELFLPFLDRIWLCLTNSLSMLTFTVHFSLESLCLFCHVSLTCFNQALNICFIIGRQM